MNPVVNMHVNFVAPQAWTAPLCVKRKAAREDGATD